MTVSKFVDSSFPQCNVHTCVQSGYLTFTHLDGYLKQWELGICMIYYNVRNRWNSHVIPRWAPNACCIVFHGVFSVFRLEIRVPFLDHKFMSYYLSLPEEIRQPQNGIEKFPIRQAFNGSGLIPDSVLWRPKDAFSDGMSSQQETWTEAIQAYAQQQVNIYVGLEWTWLF